MYVPHWICASVSVPYHRRYKRRKTPGLGALLGNLFHLRELVQGHFLWLSLNFHHCAIQSMVLDNSYDKTSLILTSLAFATIINIPNRSLSHFTVSKCSSAALSCTFFTVVSKVFTLSLLIGSQKLMMFVLIRFSLKSSHMLSTIVGATYKCSAKSAGRPTPLARSMGSVMLQGNGSVIKPVEKQDNRF